LPHDVELTSVQAPPPLQKSVGVNFPALHVAAAHAVVVPGNAQLVALVPSQLPLHAPVPAQLPWIGAPTTVVQVPTEPVTLHA
jgi:hypothetical protein